MHTSAHALEVADHRDADILSRLDRDNAMAGLAVVKPPVKPAIRALFAKVAGLGVDEGQRPFFKLMILAPRGEVLGPGQVLRDAVGKELDAGEGRTQALFDQAMARWVTSMPIQARPSFSAA